MAIHHLRTELGRQLPAQRLRVDPIVDQEPQHDGVDLAQVFDGYEKAFVRDGASSLHDRAHASAGRDHRDRTLQIGAEQGHAQ